MKITFVSPADSLTGGHRVMAIYARSLMARGHTVEVVCNAPDRFSLREQFRALRHGRWWETRDQMKPKPGHLAAYGVPHRVLDRPRPVTAADLPTADVVIATWWCTANWVADLPPGKGAKVHFMQDYEIWGGPKEQVDATCRLPMPKITPAQWLKDLLCDKFGQTRVTLAPNAVDFKTFSAPPRNKQAIPTVGFTYTSFHAKGSDIIIEAIRLARLRRPDLLVVCVSSTMPTSAMPLPAGTEFHLRATDEILRICYGACDAWLFGTRKEGFGLPILEAMACRTPVIGTPAGAALELLADGAGVLVPAENPQAMADAILELCAMTDVEWRILSEAAHRKACSYTWEDATDLFEAALQDAVLDR